MSKSNGLTITNLARRMAELDEVHDDYDNRRRKFNGAASDEDTAWAEQGRKAELYANFAYQQVRALEQMVVNLPAKTLADAGLQLTIAIDRLRWDAFHNGDSARASQLTATYRMLRSALAAIRNAGEQHEICSGDEYGYTDITDPFVPPELPVPPEPSELKLIEAAE